MTDLQKADDELAEMRRFELAHRVQGEDSFSHREVADRIKRWADRLEAAERENDGYAKAFPCDGGCNYNSGPEEECSRHGRTPRDLWSVIGEQIARAEAAEAESLRVAKEFVIGEGEAWRIVAEQRARAKAAEAKIAAIEALHVKITRYGNDYYSITQSDYEGDPSGYEDMEPFDLCAECYEVEKLICEECGGDCAIGHRSSWPCPTVAALQESEGE